MLFCVSKLSGELFLRHTKAAQHFLNAAMEQAIRDAERFHDGAPTVFHRRNRQPWLVTMLLEDWIKQYEAKIEDPKKP